VYNLTETTLISEDLAESSPAMYSGVYLKTRSSNEGKILSVPISAPDLEDEILMADFITSISTHVIETGVELMARATREDTNATEKSDLTSNDLSRFGNPVIKAAETTVVGGIIAGGILIGGIAAYKGVSGIKSAGSEKEEEIWSPGISWLLVIMAPLIWIIAQVIYSPKIRKIQESEVERHPVRREIIYALKINGFDHFNSLQKAIGTGVSTLKWHLQVLEDFGKIKTTTIGQYKIVYLRGERPAEEEVTLYCSVRSKKALTITAYFLKAPSWPVKELSQMLDINRDMVKYHCFKLVSLGILTFDELTKSFKLVEDKKDLLSWFVERSGGV